MSLGFSTDVDSPTPQISSRPVTLRTAGWTWSHQNDQYVSHSLGMSSTVKPVCSSKLVQTWMWLWSGRSAVRRGPASRAAVEQHGCLEHVGIVHAREWADSFGEIDEPIVVCPWGDLGVYQHAEQEVRWLAPSIAA